MSDLSPIIQYLCSKYPHKRELSKARLTKMVYLADWKFAIDREAQLTGIRWVFNHYGPYVDDVIECVQQNKDEFQVECTTNMHGSPKEVIALRPGRTAPDLPVEVTSTLDFVIKATSKLYWNDFIKLVYSTYPIVTQPRGSHLDLVGLAKEYLECTTDDAGE